MTKRKEKTTSQQTVTPTNPPWVQQGVQQQQGVIDALRGRDASEFVAPTSPLQSAAFNRAQANLGGGFTPPGGMSNQPVGSPEVMSMDGTPAAPVPGGGGGGSGPSWQNMTGLAGILGANAGMSGPNTLGEMTPFEAAQGQASLMDMLNAPQMGAASVDQGMIDRFLSPYLDQVYSSTMSDFDTEAGRVRAQQSANAAGSGAFGGSRFALREAQTEGELGRARASTGANIREQGFRTALDAAQQEASRMQEANRVNSQMQMQGLLSNLGFENQFGMANMDAANQAGMFNADMAMRGGMFDAGQQDNALERQLRAAGLLGDLGNMAGANERADIGLLAGLGEQQRGIDSDQRNADPIMAQLLAALQAQQPYGLFQGQQSQGTNTTTSRGSIMDGIGQAVGIGGQLGGIRFGSSK